MILRERGTEPRVHVRRRVAEGLEDGALGEERVDLGLALRVRGRGSLILQHRLHHHHDLADHVDLIDGTATRWILRTHHRNVVPDSADDLVEAVDHDVSSIAVVDLDIRIDDSRRYLHALELHRLRAKMPNALEAPALAALNLCDDEGFVRLQDVLDAGAQRSRLPIAPSTRSSFESCASHDGRHSHTPGTPFSFTRSSQPPHSCAFLPHLRHTVCDSRLPTTTSASPVSRRPA